MIGDGGLQAFIGPQAVLSEHARAARFAKVRRTRKGLTVGKTATLVMAIASSAALIGTAAAEQLEEGATTHFSVSDHATHEGVVDKRVLACDDARAAYGDSFKSAASLPPGCVILEKGTKVRFDWRDPPPGGVDAILVHRQTPVGPEIVGRWVPGMAVVCSDCR